MSIGFFDVLITILVLIAMIVPGYILRKTHMVHKISVPSMVVVLLYCCQPFLTLKAFVLAKDVTPALAIAQGMLVMLLVSLATHIALFAVARLVFSKFRDRKQAGIYEFATVFSNSGFVGIPFVAMLTGDAIATLYATIYVVAFNMMIWTLGVYIITGDIRSIKLRKAFLNPAVIVLIVALPMFFVPSINIFAMNKTVGSMVAYFGDMTTPLSMLIVGIRMADIPLKELFSNFGVYCSSFAKLIIAPIVAFGVAALLVASGVTQALDPSNYIATVLIILVAIPPAASMIAFYERYRGDVSIAVKSFICGTLLSVITLPLMLPLLMWLLSLIA